MTRHGINSLTLAAWDRATRAFRVWWASLSDPTLSGEQDAFNAYDEARRELPTLCETPAGVAMGGTA